MQESATIFNGRVHAGSNFGTKHEEQQLFVSIVNYGNTPKR